MQQQQQQRQQGPTGCNYRTDPFVFALLCPFCVCLFFCLSTWTYFIALRFLTQLAAPGDGSFPSGAGAEMLKQVPELFQTMEMTVSLPRVAGIGHLGISG